MKYKALTGMIFLSFFTTFAQDAADGVEMG